MFLGLKEMTYAKLRYGLIIGIMFLISFVVFMLSGLATGLANEFKQVVVDWKTDEIVLSDQANKNLSASQLSRKDVADVNGKEVSPIGLYSGVIGKDDNKQDISLFGTELNSFYLPEVTEGRQVKANNEAIVSQQIIDNDYKIGDTLEVGQDNVKLKIVGSFPATSFMVSPIIYTTLDSWQEAKYGDQPFKDDDARPLSAILVNGREGSSLEEGLEVLSSDELIDNIPGYSAQKLTLTAMIYLLFVIATAVIAIFMYVITLQKTANFGVMKAQGIPNWFISKSIIAQSAVVGLVGTGLAALSVYGLGFVLPKEMPFAVDFVQWTIYFVVLVVVSILGGLFSISSVRKVDPIMAIGG